MQEVPATPTDKELLKFEDAILGLTREVETYEDLTFELYSEINRFKIFALIKAEEKKGIIDRRI